MAQIKNGRDGLIKWLIGLLAAIVLGLMGGVLSHLEYSKVDREVYMTRQDAITRRLDDIAWRQQRLYDKLEQSLLLSGRRAVDCKPAGKIE